MHGRRQRSKHHDDDDHPPTTTTNSTVTVNGTTLYLERRGAGTPLLLIHGGGEDAGMLARQAEHLAAAGYDVVTYDRRGTGNSGRDDWPGRGAEQHADDAAALLEKLDWAGATVVGVSSGGVIALELLARHPDKAGPVVAWEPPAAGVLPDGAEVTAAIMKPISAHLAEHPGDYIGAQAMLLSAVVGFPVTRDDPAFAAARANAEPFVRDEPAITLAPLDRETAGRRRRDHRHRVDAQRRRRRCRRRTSPAGPVDHPSTSTPTTRCTSPTPPHSPTS